MGEEKQDPVERALELAKPVLAQVGFGSVMGYCSGTALKKIGKMVAFSVGCLFIGLQAAASTGYISVDWAKIKDSSMKSLDKVRGDMYVLNFFILFAVNVANFSATHMSFLQNYLIFCCSFSKWATLTRQKSNCNSCPRLNMENLSYIQ